MINKFFGQKEDHATLKLSNLDKFPKDVEKSKKRADKYAVKN